MTRLMKVLVGGALLLGAGLATGRAQLPSPTFPGRPTTNQPPQSPISPDDPHASRTPTEMQQKMAIARNDERQKRLIQDTDRLLALVTQLKVDVDKSDKYVLSLDVLRRSEEIEKLARSIKERARN